MKRNVLACCMALFLVFHAGSAVAAEIAVTPIGQTFDGMLMAKVLKKKLQMDIDYESLMTGDALRGHKVLIAVVGGSSKGMGAAGIDLEREKARGVALLENAKERGAKVLVMHIGRERRRGDMTDSFIEAVTGFGDVVLVVKPGNADGIFEKNKAETAVLAEAENIQGAVDMVRELLTGWGAAP